MTQMDDIQRTLGGLEEGQRNAVEGRRVLHEKIEKTDDALAEVLAQLRTISVTVQMNNEAAVKLLQRIDMVEPVVVRIEPIVEVLDKTVREIDPMARQAAAFRIEAEPIVKVVKQIRVWVIALAAFLTGLGGVGAWDYANAGPIIKTLVIEWIKSGAMPPA